MKNKNKIIENEFIWIPLDKRKSKFGGDMSPRKPELRKPLLWLTRKNHSLYLVNGSDEIIDSIIISTGGFSTYDDEEVICVEDEGDEYKNIKPDTGIKVDRFDSYCDLDLILQIHLIVESQLIGCIDIKSIIGKEKIKETVLVWDTGENAKDVTVNKIS
jgi:hypothetical protein